MTNECPFMGLPPSKEKCNVIFKYLKDHYIHDKFLSLYDDEIYFMIHHKNPPLNIREDLPDSRVVDILNRMKIICQVILATITCLPIVKHIPVDNIPVEHVLVDNIPAEHVLNHNKMP